MCLPPPALRLTFSPNGLLLVHHHKKSRLKHHLHLQRGDFPIGSARLDPHTSVEETTPGVRHCARAAGVGNDGARLVMVVHSQRIFCNHLLQPQPPRARAFRSEATLPAIHMHRAVERHLQEEELQLCSPTPSFLPRYSYPCVALTQVHTPSRSRWAKQRHRRERAGY